MEGHPNHEWLKAIHDTLMLATVMAIGIYYFVRQNSAGGRLQTAEHLLMDDDERRRRREHLAKAAEERVNSLRAEMRSVAIRCKEKKQPKSTVIQSSHEIGRCSKAKSSNIGVKDKRPQNATEELASSDYQTQNDVTNSASGLENSTSGAVDKQSQVKLDSPSASTAEFVADTSCAPSTVCAQDATITENTSCAQFTSDFPTSTDNDTCSNADSAAAAAAFVMHDNTEQRGELNCARSSLEHTTKPISLVGTASTLRDIAAEAEVDSPSAIKDVSKFDAKEICTEEVEGGTTTEAIQPNEQLSIKSMTIFFILTSSPSSPRLEQTIPVTCTATEMRKAAIEATTVENARFIFRGRVIVDSTKCLRDEYGIEDGSVIHLVGKPKDLNAITDSTDETEITHDGFVDVSQSDDQGDMDMDDEQGNSASDDNSAEFNDRAVHEAAARGDIDALRAAAANNPQLLFTLDANGWTPLHDAARAGEVDVISFLLEEAERAEQSGYFNVVSNGGNGWSALELAIRHGEEHPAALRLRELGGLAVNHTSTSSNESNNNIVSDGRSNDSNDEEDSGPSLHQAAALGDIDAMRVAAIRSPHLLYALDVNDWTPLHEAARAGNEDIIMFLMEQAVSCGPDFASLFLNAVSNGGNGWTPLALAIQFHGEDHPVTITLRRLGGRVTYPRR